jgi:acyl-CoA synthetase (AMP-forming)/AMP-acid ligase II
MALTAAAHARKIECWTCAASPGCRFRDVTSAISNSHGLGVADLVVVEPGSIPITTSGKVRRAACVEQYRQDQFARVDA